MFETAYGIGLRRRATALTIAYFESPAFAGCQLVGIQHTGYEVDLDEQPANFREDGNGAYYITELVDSLFTLTVQGQLS